MEPGPRYQTSSTFPQCKNAFLLSPHISEFRDYIFQIEIDVFRIEKSIQSVVSPCSMGSRVQVEHQKNVMQSQKKASCHMHSPPARQQAIMLETMLYQAVCRDLAESGTGVHSPMLCKAQCALSFAP